MSKNIFLIYGDDQYQIKQIRNKLISKLTTKYNDSEIINYDLAEIDFSLIFNDFWTNSMFYSKRIFIIDNLDYLLTKNESNTSLYLLKLINNQNDFIFIYNNNKLVTEKLFIKFKQQIIIYPTQKVTQNQFKKFIVNYLANKNLTISQECLEYIEQVLPKSLMIIKNELDKIINLNQNITLDFLIKNLTNYVIGDTFSLVNAIFLKDLKNFIKNYNYIKNIYQNENSIVALIFENIKLIRNIKILSKEIEDSKIIIKLNLHSYRFKILKKFSFLYSIENLNEMIDIIYDFEINKNHVFSFSDYFHLLLLKIYKVGVNKNECKSII